MEKKKFHVINLFCGCGGLSYGFIQAGFGIYAAVDHDEKALATYSKNIQAEHIINGDLSNHIFLESLIKKFHGNHVDLIIGGPPCQGFSLTGPRKLSDKRNGLYNAFIFFLKTIKPKGLVIENVPGLATLYGGQVKNEIIDTLEQIGYNVSMCILNSADYGVPQVRKRLFFVGVLKELGHFDFLKPTYYDANSIGDLSTGLNAYVTCLDAIGDLPSLEESIGEEESDYCCAPFTKYQEMMRSQSTKLYNHVGTKHKPHVVEVIAQVPEGGNYKDLPPGVGESRKFNEAWTRYHSNRPSKTIDTGHRNHFHYKYNRVPTIRENARLQSFPDTFIFTGSKTSQNRQVGNAVPPLLAQRIAEQIMIILNRGK